MSSRKAESELLHSTYASALFEYGKENNLLDELFENLEKAIIIFKNEKDFLKIIKNPRIALKDKERLLDEMGKKAKFSEDFLNFMKLLIDKKRFDIFHGIFLKFRDMYDLHRGRAKVFVYSSDGLTVSEIDKIKINLKKILKRDVIIEKKINEDLVGGIKIQFENRIYDGSVKRELESIKEKVLV